MINRLKPYLPAIFIAVILGSILGYGLGRVYLAKTSRTITFEMSPALASRDHRYNTILEGDALFPGSEVLVANVSVNKKSGKFTYEVSEVWTDFVHIEKVVGTLPNPITVVVKYDNPDDSVTMAVKLECNGDVKATDETHIVFNCSMPKYGPTEEPSEVFSPN